MNVPAHQTADAASDDTQWSGTAAAPRSGTAGAPRSCAAAAPRSGRSVRRPRLGFVGVGWIGRHRMDAVIGADCAEVVAVADASRDVALQALAGAPGAIAAASLEELLALELDGLVIATPSALHAAQAESALRAGLAVFCQKPLARTADEAARVVGAAREADRLLAIDLSYRHTAAVRSVRALARSGAIGDVYSIDLVFHNAYGPDKPWFRDPALSGGGCVIDLGTHLVDLALWMLDFPAVTAVASRLYAQGRLLPPRPAEVEDHAIAQIDLAGGTAVRLACSWNLSAGCDAVIEATFHGTRGSVSIRNVDGSFYDFVAERFDGTQRRLLAQPPDDWGGRAIVAWTARLAADRRHDPAVERAVDVAAVVDAIYGR
jgi:predicted dehydrogenase